MAKKVEKRVPDVRFKGFTDDWEQQKLGDFGSVQMNKRIFKNQTSETGEVPFYKIGTFGKKADSFISNKIFQQYKRDYPYPHKGDLLISASGSIGRVIEYRGEQAYYQDSNIVWLEHNSELLNSFLKAFYQIVKWDGIEGSTIKRLYNKNILNTKITLPKIAEQQNVGYLFRAIDNLIALQHKKLEQLRLLKKAMLQQLFPDKDGKLQSRFNGFTDAWEQRKLGDVVAIIMGQSPASKNYTENPNDYILVQGNADMKDGRVAPRVWTTQITKQAEKGDLILSVRAPVGDVGRTDYDVVIGRGVAAVKGNEYIFQLLTKMKDSGYWTMFSTGSTFESINSSNIKNAQVMIPTEKEQNQIGAFLHHYDSLIALHQRKLDHLQLLKKFLLQKIFI
ncbi:MAG: restriction endonuclease subunit S [Limosilactobacillus oris]|jgi:type I restriction enzyme S subunit|uniref:restriction endonuclease subunit S n=1 Tax=Limosilactobacillus oris TaxID=1632 RepID=UPI00242D392B|nr:restriction endonuclease subunit S [Limosilactobacillus oris]MCH3911802.1 restriction endonuclease subunit S [Limosilactobacillus oris]MCH3939053.1 restriction endonuclease subunit S [Limosilactobacillus oris]MCI1979881.1 restriction endonuclease subunit S [Limosilactobacillus oris]MCI2042556.1 restriction endonuclease subunit S [Limosilactobacillus oris]